MEDGACDGGRGYVAWMDSWRLEDVGERGRLAWFYLRPHEVDYLSARHQVIGAGWMITEERQCLVDDQLGACIRYLAVRDDGGVTPYCSEL